MSGRVITEALVEPHGVTIDIRGDGRASLLASEVLCNLKHLPSVTKTLGVFDDRDATQPGDGRIEINTHHTDRSTCGQEEEGMVTRRAIIRMIGVVTLLTSCVPEHLPADGMKREPVILRGHTTEFNGIRVRSHGNGGCLCNLHPCAACQPSLSPYPPVTS